MMILLPGILSQGGKKHVWERHEINYTEIAGTAGSVELLSTITKRAASAYSRTGALFELESPTTTRVSALTAGKYIVDISASNDSEDSGSTLYRVDNKTAMAREAYFVLEEESTKLRTDSVAYYTSYATTASAFTVSGRKSVNAGTLKVGTVMYSESFEFYLRAMGSFYPLCKGTVLSAPVNTGETNDAGDYIYEVEIKTEYGFLSDAKYTIDYTPYTATASMGSLIDTVKSKETTTYPDNGIQDGYWYVRIQ